MTGMMAIDPYPPAAGDLAGLDRDLHVGRTGVAGILRNGQGPTTSLRAGMDGLPAAE